jgi:signal peptidase I
LAAVTTPPKRAEPGVVQWLWDWVKSIGFAVALWMTLRTFFVEAFRIPSGSMEQTLLVGDFLFVNKLIYGAEVPLVGWHLPAVREPKRDDIVVFDSVKDSSEVIWPLRGPLAAWQGARSMEINTREPIKVVKRMVGVPGDTLWMEAGQLWRNGAKVNEPWAQHLDASRGEDAYQRGVMRAWQLTHLVKRDAEQYRPDLQEWGPIVVPADSFFMMGDNRDLSYDGRYWGFLPRKNVRGQPLFVYFSYDAESYKALPFLTAVRWGRIFSQPK